MSFTSLTYTPPIRRSFAGSTLDYQLLEAAGELFDGGSFLESTQKVFEHLFPHQAGIDLAQPFSFVQGSSKVTARIDDGIFFLSVPLVRLPAGGGAVAALRYVLSKINSSGQLYQARLHGDDLQLEFSEKLSGLHPQKLLEVLRRMPIDADRHDDWMISQFGAIAVERGSVEPLSADELAVAHEVWRLHWNDVEELLKEAQRKRSMFFLNEVTAFAVNRIRFVVPLGGSVLPRLLESAGTFNNSHVDPLKRETTLGKTIKEMKAVSADELGQALGHATYAISPFTEGTAAQLTSFYGPGNYMDAVEHYRNNGQSLDAALPLWGTFYYLLASHWWPSEIEAEMKRGLAEASGKPFRDEANILHAHAKALVEKFGGDESDDEDGDEDEDEGEEEGEAQ